jgi:hypothetical protein
MSARAVKQDPATEISNVEWNSTWGVSDIWDDDGSTYYLTTASLAATVVFGAYPSFNVPYDASILGVELAIKAYLEATCSGGSAITIELSSKTGTYYSKARSIGVPANTPTVYMLGHGGDWWGESPLSPPIGWIPPDWRPNTFNDGASFRVRMKAGKPSGTGCEPGYTWQENVDYIWVYVYYKRPSSPDIHRATLRTKKFL